jgi:hypothetical protein
MSGSATDPNALKDSTKALGGVVGSLHRLAPGAVTVLMILAGGLVATAAVTVKGIVAVLIIIVVISALGVYRATRKYGESSLALILGLFTVFTVTWTVTRFIAFAVAWIAFALSILLFAAIRVASDSESIYVDAACLYADSAPEQKKVRATLEAIGKKTEATHGLLGPIDRARVIRRAAQRRVEVPALNTVLASVDILFTVTKADPEVITDFVVGFGQILVAEADRGADQADLALDAIAGSGAPAADFFDAFNRTRHLVQDQLVDREGFMALLEQGLARGVGPDQIEPYIKEHITRPDA